MLRCVLVHACCILPSPSKCPCQHCWLVNQGLPHTEQPVDRQVKTKVMKLLVPAFTCPRVTELSRKRTVDVTAPTPSSHLIFLSFFPEMTSDVRVKRYCSQAGGSLATSSDSFPGREARRTEVLLASPVFRGPESRSPRGSSLHGSRNGLRITVSFAAFGSHLNRESLKNKVTLVV